MKQTQGARMCTCKFIGIPEANLGCKIIHCGENIELSARAEVISEGLTVLAEAL